MRSDNTASVYKHDSHDSHDSSVTQNVFTDERHVNIQEDWEALAREYAPEFHFYETEEYLPSSVEWFLARAELQYSENPKGGYGVFETVVPNGKIDSQNLANIVIRHTDHNKLQVFEGIDPMENDIATGVPFDHYATFSNNSFQLKLVDKKDYKGNLESARCYAHTHYLEGTHQIEISYSLFFPYNGPLPASKLFNWFSSLTNVGTHEGDWEHITIRLKNDSHVEKNPMHRIEGVFLSAHSDNEGEWYTVDKIRPQAHANRNEKNTLFLKGEQIVAWVAKSTHGIYNRDGEIQRRTSEAGGIGNEILPYELTSETANIKKLNCAANLEYVTEQLEHSQPPHRHWMFFNGRWGANPGGLLTSGNGPTGPMFKSYWKKEPKKFIEK